MSERALNKNEPRSSLQPSGVTRLRVSLAAWVRGASLTQVCGSTVERLLHRAAMGNDGGGTATVAARALVDRAWEELHAGHWSSVPYEWRRVYALAACFLACRAGAPPAEAVHWLDRAFILGDPPDVSSVHAAVTELHALAQENSCSSGHRAREWCLPREPLAPPGDVQHFPGRCTMPVVTAPSLSSFSEHLRANKTALLVGCMQHWPALSTRPWSRLAYLRAVMGERLVPVEVGGSYTDGDWTQRLMTVNEFLDTYVLATTMTMRDSAKRLRVETPARGYLAQHNLFDQVPALRRDIAVPDYCAVAEWDEAPDASEGAAPPIQINAWLGPAGTISPAHTDPRHNLLAQVVGYKYVRLFPPSEAPHLYPHEDPLLFNTSRVDVVQPDLAAFPQVYNAAYVDCVLGPGQMLFIPRGWWHYVRSLCPSFSVSFWFG